jgi:hypothetical protein
MVLHWAQFKESSPNSIVSTMASVRLPPFARVSFAVTLRVVAANWTGETLRPPFESHRQHVKTEETTITGFSKPSLRFFAVKPDIRWQRLATGFATRKPLEISMDSVLFSG